MRQQSPTILTPELWAHIFALLGTVAAMEATHITRRLNTYLRQMLTVRLVCKTFDAIHATHLNMLALPDHISLSQLPCLLAWLRHSKPPLQILVVKTSNPAVETVLASLLCLNMPLRIIDMSLIHQDNNCIIQLMSAFSNLKNLALFCNLQQDLEPL